MLYIHVSSHLSKSIQFIQYARSILLHDLFSIVIFLLALVHAFLCAGVGGGGRFVLFHSCRELAVNGYLRFAGSSAQGGEVGCAHRGRGYEGRWGGDRGGVREGRIGGGIVGRGKDLGGWW